MEPQLPNFLEVTIFFIAVIVTIFHFVMLKNIVDAVKKNTEELKNQGQILSEYFQKVL